MKVLKLSRSRKVMVLVILMSLKIINQPRVNKNKMIKKTGGLSAMDLQKIESCLQTKAKRLNLRLTHPNFSNKKLNSKKIYNLKRWN
jgi:hypothetical protein